MQLAETATTIRSWRPLRRCQRRRLRGRQPPHRLGWQPWRRQRAQLRGHRGQRRQEDLQAHQRCSHDDLHQRRFAIVNHAKLPKKVGQSAVVRARAYDAGTETNTEDFAHLVPPCQPLVGISSDDEGVGASDPALAEGALSSRTPASPAAPISMSRRTRSLRTPPSWSSSVSPNPPRSGRPSPDRPSAPGLRWPGALPCFDPFWLGRDRLDLDLCRRRGCDSWLAGTNDGAVHLVGHCVRGPNLYVSQPDRTEPVPELEIDKAPRCSRCTSRVRAALLASAGPRPRCR